MDSLEVQGTFCVAIIGARLTRKALRGSREVRDRAAGAGAAAGGAAVVAEMSQLTWHANLHTSRAKGWFLTTTTTAEKVLIKKENSDQVARSNIDLASGKMPSLLTAGKS